MAIINDKNDKGKKWLYATLAAATLMLGACADKEATTAEAGTATDAQVEVEQGATGVSTADKATENDIAIASADDEAMAVGNKDDVAVATADDDVLDGSEQQEHVSTY
ncbi:hypothetical protein HQR03_03250 [Psychrobacter okhotskensis]|uniref:hypothetical protein n=1 Tax=Psychrobacter TaxID=497 RepID=UPI001919CB5D|nr:MULTISPECIES: hypothetical protein [Psychrobacter]NRD69553.1 hypothetical protein [Psychrobacter okhotskensis]